DVVAVFDDRDDSRVFQRARVPGLPAALGVEGRAVEHDRRPPVVIAPSDYGRLELEQVRVAAVEPLRHAGYCTRNDCSPGTSFRSSPRHANAPVRPGGSVIFALRAPCWRRYETEIGPFGCGSVASSVSSVPR